MSDRLRIYVSGPMTHGDIAVNVSNATKAARELIAAGFAPMVPQLTAYMDGHPPKKDVGGFSHGDWMAVDIPWVKVSDAVLRLPGQSIGADLEVEEARREGIPVYGTVLELVGNPPPTGGDARFLKLLRQMERMHKKKAADYGSGEDPLANIRASAEFGVPPWIGAVVRENDKTTRIKSFIRNGSLKNEPIRDSFLDKAAYSLISLILYDEHASEQEKAKMKSG